MKLTIPVAIIGMASTTQAFTTDKVVWAAYLQYIAEFSKTHSNYQEFTYRMGNF